MLAEVARLPPRLRWCVVLCDLEGMTYAQAARTLGVPLGTVQSRLAQARTAAEAAHGAVGGRTAERGGDCGTPMAVVPDLVRRTVSLRSLLAAEPATVPLNLGANITLLMKGASSMRLAPILPRLAGVSCSRCLPAAWRSIPSGRSGNSARRSSGHAPRVLALPRREPPRGDPALAPRELGGGRGERQDPRLRTRSRGEETTRRARGGAKCEPRRFKRQGQVEPRKFKETERELSSAVVKQHHPKLGDPENAGCGRGRPRVPGPILQRSSKLARQELANEGIWSEWRLVDVDATDAGPRESPRRGRGAPFRPSSASRFSSTRFPIRADGRWSRVEPRADPDDEPPHGTTRRRAVAPGPKEPLLAALRSDELMMRSFDFSVVPRQTYRYRARIVFLAPAAGRSWQRRPANGAGRRSPSRSRGRQRAGRAGPGLKARAQDNLP